MAKASKITIDCGNPLVIHDDVSLHHVAYSNHQIIVARPPSGDQLFSTSLRCLAWEGKLELPLLNFEPFEHWRRDHDNYENLIATYEQNIAKLFSQQIIFTISTKHSNTEQNELNYLNSDLSWPISCCVALLMLLPPHWGRWRPNVSTDVRKKFELQYLVLAQLHH